SGAHYLGGPVACRARGVDRVSAEPILEPQEDVGWDPDEAEALQRLIDKDVDAGDYLDSPNGGAPEAIALGDPSVTHDEFIASKPDADVEALIECEQGPAAVPAGLIKLVSKSGAGKTTSMTDLTVHAASGVEWCGLTFPRPL